MEMAVKYCGPINEKTSKYIEALSMCCSMAIEVSLSSRQFKQYDFSRNPKVTVTGIYNDDIVKESCARLASTKREHVYNILKFDSLCNAFKQKDNINVDFQLTDANSNSVSTHNCIICFFEENEENFALIIVKDISVEAKADLLNRENSNLREEQLMNDRYKMVVEQTGTVVFEWAKDKAAKYISPLMSEFFSGNYDGREILSVWREDNVIHPDDYKLLMDKLASNNGPSTQKPMHIRLMGHNGQYLWCKLCFAFYRSESGELDRVIGMLNNEDEAVCSRMTLEYRAQYDLLTGVYNAQTFYTNSTKMLREHPENNYSIMRMDISRFKAINELYGIDEGDRILCRISASLETALLGIGICGRLYSDVFAMCVTFKTTEQLGELINKMTHSVRTILPGSGIHPYFGVFIVDDRTIPSSILCDRAGVALMQVKGSLLKNYAFYDNALHAREIAERRIETQMEHALINGEFIIYLQPKHSLISSRPIGAEALVRWNRPNEGLLTPASFIPIFERNGFIIKLDEFVWEEVFKLIRKWLDKGISPVPISVNVSRVHIYNPYFVERLIELMQKYNVPGYLIELELTETSFVDNQEELYKSLISLQDKGVNFSIDDFGSGYSSLNMLKSAPAGILKLDREFLCAAAGNEKAETVVKHTISMANQLNMQVVAEGVENESQAQFLIDAGCIAAQGYFYSHPMPVTDFENLMLYEKV